VQIAHSEELSDDPMLSLYRAPPDLGGMRREDELDVEVTEACGDISRGNARFDKATETLVDGPPLWRPVAGGLILTPSADSVLLFGDVGQRQKVRKSPGNPVHFAHGQAGDQELELIAGGPIPLAASLGERPYLLYEGVDVLALMLANDLAEDLAQKLDIATERGVNAIGVLHVPCHVTHYPLVE
jgi:hypothetical protein